MMKKVIILGGGVGGLASAHELSKYNQKEKKYDIHVYERNSELGGQARSSYNSDEKHSEYCWHAVGASSYKNFLNIMNEIVDHDGIKAISHLKPLNKFIYGCETEIEGNNDKALNYIEYGKAFLTDFNLFMPGFKALYGRSIPLWDKIRLGWIYFKANAMCKDRLNSTDSILWKETMDRSRQT